MDHAYRALRLAATGKEPAPLPPLVGKEAVKEMRAPSVLEGGSNRLLSKE